MEYELFKASYRATVEHYLNEAFDAQPATEVVRVARYISLGGGHRWRALVAAAAGQVFRDDANTIVLPGAAGVELAHAASLILDDLPSMDDGKMRRGNPCAHRVFPRWAVDMVPVFLVTLSYELALSNPLSTPEQRVASARVLSQAGLAMIVGQEHDVASTLDGDEERLLHRYRLKSGALYSSAAEGGAILCGASKACVAKMASAGMLLGLAYQFLDDVADVVANPNTVGKDTQVDANKLTSVSLFGVEGAKARSVEFQNQALQELASFGKQADLLRKLVTHAGWSAS